MTGEIKFFRKRFFGGFNRDDVVKYISKLANERNECRSAKEIAEEEARSLADEAGALRLEFETAKKDTERDREAREKAEQDAQTLAIEVETLRLEIDDAKRALDEGRKAKDIAEQDVRNLADDIASLRRELEKAKEDAKREADEGRRYKAEALEAKAKAETLDVVKKNFAELEPAFENLRTAFGDQATVSWLG